MAEFWLNIRTICTYTTAGYTSKYTAKHSRTGISAHMCVNTYTYIVHVDLCALPMWAYSCFLFHRKMPVILYLYAVPRRCIRASICKMYRPILINRFLNTASIKVEDNRNFHYG